MLAIKGFFAAELARFGLFDRGALLTFPLSFMASFFLRAFRSWFLPVWLVAVASIASAAVQIVTPPVARTVLEPGQALELSVVATGDGPLTYRWLRRGLPLAGETGPTLRVETPRPVDYAPYIVEVEDGTGSVARAAAFVLFNPGRVEVFSLDTGAPALPQLPQPMDIVGAASGLLLRADGGVSAYGTGPLATALPADLTDVVQVAGGDNWGAALRSDGTVRVWGPATQPSTWDPPTGPSPAEVQAWSEVVLLRNASTFLFGVRRDGTWVYSGVSNFGGGVQSSQLAPYAGQTNVAEVVFPDYYGFGPVFLLRDGNVRVRDVTLAAPAGAVMNALAISARGTSLGVLRKDGLTLFRDSSSAALADRSIRASTDAFAIHAFARNGPVLVEADGTLRFAGTPDRAQQEVNGSPVVSVIELSASYLAIRDARGDLPPSLLAPPIGQAINAGETVRLQVAAVGSRLHYQWFKGSAAFSLDSPTLTLTATTVATSGEYRVRVFNHLGELNPPPVRVWVNAPPPPAPPAPVTPVLALAGTGATRQTVAVGATLALGVTPSLAGELTYRWTKDGRVLAGETGPTLERTIAGPNDAGLYAVRGTSAAGSVAVRIFRVDVLTADPVVLVWGKGTEDLSFEPPALTQAVFKVAGSPENARLGLVVQADGTLRTWGTASAPSLSGLTGLLDVAVENGTRISGLRPDGTANGNNTFATPSASDNATDLVKIVSGGNGFIGLRSDGRVVEWWAGFVEVPADLPPAVDIAAGYYSALALLADGTVRGLGVESTEVANVPEGLADVVALAAANYRYLALRADGTVAAWGDDLTASADFVPPAGLSDVVAVHATEDEFLARRADGSLVRWGSVDNGLAAVPAAAAQAARWEFARDRALALLPRSAVPAPVLEQASPAMVSAVAGQDLTLEVAASGDMLRYQWSFAGQPIQGATRPSYRFLAGLDKAGLYTVRVSNMVGSFEAVTDVVVTPGSTSGFAVRPAAVAVVAEGDPLVLSATPASLPGPLSYTWRRDGVPLVGATGAELSLGALGLGDDGLYSLEVVAADGSRHVTLTRVRVLPAERDPALAIWRAGTVPAALEAPIALAAGNGFFVGVNEDGTVHAWGTGAAVTGLPAGLGDVVAVAAGEGHALALKSDGTVVAWGSNASGESTVPVGLGDVVQVVADGAHSLALKRDGSVVGWGATATGIVSPPLGAGGFIQLAVGGVHALALRPDGSVAAWGQNASGQATVPEDLAGATQIAAGTSVSYALLADGSVRRWGSATGILAAPVDAPVRRLAARGSQLVGLRTDGTFTTWSSPSLLREYVAVDLVALTPTDVVVYGDTIVPTAPLLVRGLQDAVAWNDGAARFEVVVEGQGLSYQWRRNGSVITGSGPVLTLGPINGSSLYGTYSVTVSNSRGQVSSSAVLSAGDVPSLFTSVPPPRQIVPLGSSLTLSVVAGGVAPLEYRWFHDGQPIAGATGPQLVVPSMGVPQTGLYAVAVQDASGARSVALSMVRVRGLAPVATRIASAESSHFEPALHDAPYQAVALGTLGGLGLGLDGRLAQWGSIIRIGEFGDQTVGFSGGMGSTSSTTLVITRAGELIGTTSRLNGNISTSLPRVHWPDLVDLRVFETTAVFLRSNGTLVFSRSTSNSGVLRVDNVVRLVGGDAHSVAIDMDRRPHTFGSSFAERLTMPADLVEVKDLAMGTAHTVAVRPNGTVVAWGGTNFAGQTTVPEGLDNVVRVAAGRDFSIAWRADGSAMRWGRVTPAGDLAMAAPPGAQVTVGPDEAAVIFEVPSATPPLITAVSGGGVVRPGAATTLAVTASGEELLYQWFRDGVTLSSGTGAEYTIAAAAATDAGLYTVRVRNPAGTVWSEARVLRVIAPPSLPSPGELIYGVGLGGTAALPYLGGGSPVIEALELPAWASFDPLTARLTGNPPDVGPLHYTARLRVSNEIGDVVEADYPLEAPASFEGWRQRHFDATERANPAVSGPGATPAGDGVPNLLKYALGVPPRAALPADATEPEEAARARLVYHRPANRVDVDYAPERSTDLAGWGEAGLVQELIGEDAAAGWQSWRARLGDETGARPAREFLRLRASLPEAGAE